MKVVKSAKEIEADKKQKERDEITIDNLLILKLAFVVAKGKSIKDLYALMETTGFRYTNSISELGEPRTAVLTDKNYLYLANRLRISEPIIAARKRFNIGMEESFWQELREERKKRAKLYQKNQSEADCVNEDEDNENEGKQYKKLKDRIKILIDEPERCECIDFKKVIAYVKSSRFQSFEKLMLDNFESQVNQWLKLSIGDMLTMNYEQLNTMYSKNMKLQERIKGVLSFRDNDNKDI